MSAHIKTAHCREHRKSTPTARRCNAKMPPLSTRWFAIMSDWTAEEISTLISLWPVASAAQIARRLHRPTGAVSGKASRLRREGVLPAGGVAKRYDVKPWRARSHLVCHPTHLKSAPAKPPPRRARHAAVLADRARHYQVSLAARRYRKGRDDVLRRRCGAAGLLPASLAASAGQSRVTLTPNQRRDLLRIEP